MTNTITLKKPTILALQKIISLLSFLMTVLCAGLVLFGFVPLYGRNMTVYDMINSFFTVFDIGKRSFWFCAFSAGFAIFYFVAVGMIIKNLIVDLVKIKAWMFSKNENGDTRKAVKTVVTGYNNSILLLFALLVFSFLIENFKMTPGTLLIVILLILFYTLINAARILYFKRNIFETIAISLSSGFLLSTLLIVTFIITKVQFSTIINVTLACLRAGEVVFSSPQFVFQTVMMQIIAPFFYFLVITSILSILYKLHDVDASRRGVARNLLIRNSIFLVALIVVIGYINDYRDILEYFKMLLEQISFIGVTVLIFLSTQTSLETVQDAEVCDPYTESRYTAYNNASDSSTCE